MSTSLFSLIRKIAWISYFSCSLERFLLSQNTKLTKITLGVKLSFNHKGLQAKFKSETKYWKKQTNKKQPTSQKRNKQIKKISQTHMNTGEWKKRLPKTSRLLLSEVPKSEWLIRWRVCYWPSWQQNLTSLLFNLTKF